MKSAKPADWKQTEHINCGGVNDHCNTKEFQPTEAWIWSENRLTLAVIVCIYQARHIGWAAELTLAAAAGQKSVRQSDFWL